MISTYNGFNACVKEYTNAELIEIDKDLPNTGSSQEAGWYWDEIDDDGEQIGAPCGPYKTAEEALENWKKTVDDLKRS